MALGGGTFIAQNKVLPGAYINFISVAKATATLSDRGFAAMGLELDWGQDGQIFEVTQGDFQKDSMKIFGYSYADDKLKGIREMMSKLTTLYAYKLTSGGQKASNDIATAKYCGVRGNDIKIAIQTNVDDNDMFDVQTILDTTIVDVQTVAKAEDLVANDFVSFKNKELALTASTPLAGGTNGTADAAAHQAFLDKVESYPSINAIGYVGTDNTIKSLYAAFTERMRDSVGVKFVAVLYNKAADYEGVINVKNKVLDADVDEASLVYWATGVAAGTAVNASATNMIYDGEYTVDTNYTQSQLEKAIKAGEFTFHQVGDKVRVLTDINSLVTTTVNKGEDFKSNQTIRVLDQIATDIASLFVTKYLGVIPNDADGRTSLWNDIVKHHQQLLSLRAIENFTEEDVQVAQGDTKKAVVVSDAVTVVNAMEKLYMTVMVA
jgi:hypothetical protein